MHMDTFIFNSPVAMGTGEQQTVRSFFRQGSREGSIQSGLSLHFDSDFTARGNAPVPSSVVSKPSESAFTYPLPSVGSQHFDAEHTSQPSTSAQSEITMEQVSTISSQDEEPNASRRKRRKTEKPRSTEQDTNVQSGLSGWLGMEVVPAATPVVAAKSDQTQAVAVPPRGLFLHPQPTEADSKPDSTNAQEGGKRKTMKLNSNGRLRSSPPAKTPETTSAKRTTGKRGRPRKTESKMVIIKYTAGGEKNIGESINKILIGQMVHDDAPKRQNVHIPKTQPDKPTHPFFLKKQAQKETALDESQTQTPAQTSRSNTPASSRAGGTAPEREFRPFALTLAGDRRDSKFSGSIEPIWPPQDLVHIRGIEQQIETGFERVEKDCKKAKSAVISISDEENVLLVSTAHARKAAQQSLVDDGYARPSLRFPGKHIASGRVLQTAIESQMSWSLPESPSKANSSIHVIEKLRAALLSSVSAFDRGKYESQLWAHKYAPEMGEDVLQIGREPQVLRDWLEKLKIVAVDTGKLSSDGSKMKVEREQRQTKRRKKADKLDGFIVSSDEEASEMDSLSGSDDELAGDVTISSQRTAVRSGDVSHGSHGEKKAIANAILLSGVPGSGKTASVYAVAKELDFEVFEINPGSRRNARDMLERVGDMTQNHLVHILNESEESSSRSHDFDRHDDAKQNKLNGFLKSSTSKHTKPVTKSAQKSPAPSSEPKRARQQKQSLILLEEADILFEEDKQFWTGVLTLISQSRRPIVITCNDESLIPTAEMSLHAILRYQKPSRDLAIDYLLLVAANEGHVLKRDAVSKLFDASGMDIRRSLMDLNFWCQIGVGSEKAGLDWILSSWPPEANVDENGDRLRMLSLNTYKPYMGWFNRDALLETDPLSQETEALRNTFHWWRLSIADAEDAERQSDVEMVPLDKFRSHTQGRQLELLSREADYLDMRSSLDILSSGCQMDMKKVSIILRLY